MQDRPLMIQTPEELTGVDALRMREVQDAYERGEFKLPKIRQPKVTPAMGQEMFRTRVEAKMRDAVNYAASKGYTPQEVANIFIQAVKEKVSRETARQGLVSNASEVRPEVREAVLASTGDLTADELMGK